MTLIKKQRAYRFGLLTEYYIICYLFFCGYLLLKHRYKTYLGEIDLIFKKGKTIIAVEVKGRKNKDATIENTITKKQFERIYNGLNIFLSQNDKYNRYDLRIDAVMVRGILNIEYKKNSFYL
jgi:putative endonuclease